MCGLDQINNNNNREYILGGIIGEIPPDFQTIAWVTAEILHQNQIPDLHETEVVTTILKDETITEEMIEEMIEEMMEEMTEFGAEATVFENQEEVGMKIGATVEGILGKISALEVATELAIEVATELAIEVEIEIIGAIIQAIIQEVELIPKVVPLGEIWTIKVHRLSKDGPNLP